MSKNKNLSHFGKSALLLSFLSLSSLAVTAQSIVKGTVKDSNGDPVIGATVRVAGSKGGTVTDLDGNKHRCKYWWWRYDSSKQCPCEELLNPR